MKITTRTDRMTKKDKEDFNKEGCVLLASVEKITYTPREKKIMKEITRKQAEKFFDINLKYRDFGLEFTALSGKHRQYAELSYHDKRNCFGYSKKIPIKTFWERLSADK